MIDVGENERTCSRTFYVHRKVLAGILHQSSFSHLNSQSTDIFSNNDVIAQSAKHLAKIELASRYDENCNDHENNCPVIPIIQLI